MYGDIVHGKDGISYLRGMESLMNGVRIIGYPFGGKKLKPYLKPVTRTNSRKIKKTKLHNYLKI